MKVAIYTYLFGKYDTIRKPDVIENDYDYYLFTDQDIALYPYKVIKSRPTTNKIKTARYYKIFAGYEYLCSLGYDVIISHDANIHVVGHLHNIIDEMVTDFMVMKHPNRSCIYDEYEACVMADKDDPLVMYNQIKRYAEAGYPEDGGLMATGVMLRKNSNEAMGISSRWVGEVTKESIRDQLSLPYILWKYDYKIDLIPFDDILTFYFNKNEHTNNRSNRFFRQ